MRLQHQPGQIAAQHLGEACPHISGRGRVDFEGTHAVEHVVRINGGDGRGVSVAAEAQDRHRSI